MPASEYRPSNDREKEDSEPLQWICDDSSCDNEAAESTKDRGIRGPCSVGAGCVFTTSKYEDAKDGEEEEEVLGYTSSIVSIICYLARNNVSLTNKCNETVESSGDGI